MILAILELQNDGAWNRMSLETLEAAQQIGRELALPVVAAVAGGDLARRAAELANRNLERVYAVQHELLGQYTADGYTAALEQIIRKAQPQLVLFPHTYQVRDFAPKLATRFRRGLVSDAIGHRVENGSLVFVRQFFQGKLNAEVRFTTDAPNFASIQAGAYRTGEIVQGQAEVETFAPQLAASDIRTKPEAPFRESAKGVDLTAASIIVSVGRGIKDKDNLGVVENLAKALNAELAASRPICDNGWLPMERQVGSSGQTVAPKLYVAVGISGAIQHLVGMKGSRTIVAINKDANAPIFEVADYGIVGDLFEVVPALTDEVAKAKG
ncbi:MAG TPA: electron transfer flavoprotein subunit alpha/FixB family protein [Bryobacteraceae bacterium]|nr:electron transfer flavoprotein subunit alpha/FixB family protein [Bryobacteraceae bacterium]